MVYLQWFIIIHSENVHMLDYEHHMWWLFYCMKTSTIGVIREILKKILPKHYLRVKNTNVFCEMSVKINCNQNLRCFGDHFIEYFRVCWVWKHRWQNQTRLIFSTFLFTPKIIFNNNICDIVIRNSCKMQYVSVQLMYMNSNFS